MSDYNLYRRMEDDGGGGGGFRAYSSRRQIGVFQGPKILQIGEFQGPTTLWPEWRVLGP